MNAKELQESWEKLRSEKERTDKAEAQDKAATEKDGAWKADAQKLAADINEKAIKDNITSDQKGVLEATKKESERVKSLAEKAKEKPKEQQYNPVFDRAGMEREQYAREHPQQQKVQHVQQHGDRTGDSGVSREMDATRQHMCKDAATQQLSKMSPELKETLKKGFESDMTKAGDNRRLTDAGLHHKVSEQIMDQRGVPREDAVDRQAIAAGKAGMAGKGVYQDDVLRKQEAERYLPAAEKAKEPDKGKGKEPPAQDPEKVAVGPGPDKPGPAPAHAHAHGHHMPWDKNPKAAGEKGHHLSKESGQELAQGKPWEKQQSADPDRAESRLASQAREREKEQSR